jgi:hypothetical protein
MIPPNHRFGSGVGKVNSVAVDDSTASSDLPIVPLPSAAKILFHHPESKNGDGQQGDSAEHEDGTSLEVLFHVNTLKTFG